jgi:hypothetical protein
MRLPQKPPACIQGEFSAKGKRLNSGIVRVSVSISFSIEAITRKAKSRQINRFPSFMSSFPSFL